jgi:hypothetical protein
LDEIDIEKNETTIIIKTVSQYGNIAFNKTPTIVPQNTNG